MPVEGYELLCTAVDPLHWMVLRRLAAGQVPDCEIVPFGGRERDVLPCGLCPGAGTVRSVDVSTRLEATAVEVETASGLFAALADPARLRILAELGGGQLCVCDIQERVPLAGNLLSYHLRGLREAGLISGTKRGRWIDYRLSSEGLRRHVGAGR